jgi:CheY-like chemotaxis protein
VSNKILIVEDNTDSRNLLHHLFTGKKYGVSTAVDGAEGFYMAKAEKPDLIITDLMMPNVDGVDLIKQLRAEPETADIPIVIYTAFGLGETAQEALNAGANRLFSKPFDLDDLIQFAVDSLSQSGES